MRERVELVAYRFDHGRVPVAEIHDADPAREVHELATVHVPEPRAFGASDEERVRSGDTARDGTTTTVEKVACTRARCFHESISRRTVVVDIRPRPERHPAWVDFRPTSGTV